MFETAVVRERAVAQRRYPLFVASVAVHSVIVVAVVIVSIHAVTLPTHPPSEIVPFIEVAPPPPPAQAPAQRHVQQQPAQAHAAAAPHAATAPAALTAPNHVPDTIPTVPSSSNATNLLAAGDPNASASTNIGVPNGDPNGVGDDITSTGNVPVPETVFHPGGEVRPATVLQRVDPAYPRAAINVRLGATVVLKCIIDKSGNVRDAEVVTSSHPAFNEPALAALRQWRFAPGVFHGKPVDTFFELTIRFQAR
jgi:TonB family protein